MSELDPFVIGVSNKLLQILPNLLWRLQRDTMNRVYGVLDWEVRNNKAVLMKAFNASDLDELQELVDNEWFILPLSSFLEQLSNKEIDLNYRFIDTLIGDD